MHIIYIYIYTYMCMYIHKSLSCTPEASKTLQINYSSVKKKKKRYPSIK